MIDSWTRLLNHHREQVPFEIDNLAICLVQRQVNDWLIHLRDVAIYAHSHPQAQVRPYTLKEVKEITQAMTASTDAPLSAVLNREEGTLRFGHALRLLGNYNPAPLRDLVDALDSVQTCDQLLRTLAQVAQECAIASAKSQFIVVPCDDDLKYLLDDIDRYGARKIAGLLIILSSLRYPRVPDEGVGKAKPENEGEKQNDN